MKWSIRYTELQKFSKMLISLLVGREVGVVNGLSLRRAERFKRAKSLQLCNDRNMEQCFSSGVNSLDLERQESR